MTTPVVSEAYKPREPNVVVDEPYEGHYQEQGYAIGYETTPDGQNVPEGGNTAIFNIVPRGITEPVFVTKPEEGSTFTVKVLEGVGRFIRARADGQVDDEYIMAGSEVVVHPGESYAYVNISDHEDMLLHDVALPAFNVGDDIDLRSSLIPEEAPNVRDGYSAVVARTEDGENRVVEVPDEFTNLLAEAMAEMVEVREVAWPNVAKFMDRLSVHVGTIPELASMAIYARQNPDKVSHIFRQYVGLVESMAKLSGYQLGRIDDIAEKLEQSREDSDHMSASRLDATDVIGGLDQVGRDSLANAAKDMIKPESEFYDVAFDQMVEMLEKGHRMKVAGKTPRDGDPESDQSIWGHTQITDPEAMVHFIFSHYAERYLSRVLAEHGLDFAMTEKDYFINAMTDTLLTDRFTLNKFGEVFEMWLKPRAEGQVGWISPDRHQAYLDRYDEEFKPILFPQYYREQSRVQAGEYKLVDGTDAPVETKAGRIMTYKNDEQDLDRRLPGIKVRGHYFDDEHGRSQIVSFLYYKQNSEGELETEERVILFGGIGYGELLPDHAGQPPTWYIIGPQLGTFDPETREFHGFPEEDVKIPAKNFSIACIVGGPLGEPILANPRKGS